MLPGFIRTEALEILVEETNRRIGDAWFCKSTHNVYLTPNDCTPNDPGTPTGRRGAPAGTNLRWARCPMIG